MSWVNCRAPHICTCLVNLLRFLTLAHANWLPWPIFEVTVINLNIYYIVNDRRSIFHNILFLCAFEPFLQNTFACMLVSNACPCCMPCSDGQEGAVPEQLAGHDWPRPPASSGGTWERHDLDAAWRVPLPLPTLTAKTTQVCRVEQLCDRLSGKFQFINIKITMIMTPGRSILWAWLDSAILRSLNLVQESNEQLSFVNF